ncbi:DUF4183 domain-containing protein [Priestia flexa]|uniref:DUF4183 domain-containing protein n=1 Tax=Priestia flexa TaxID=86664 RepID=UPI0010FBD8AB|nr:DUF4183 domain-containing protein [Priestia flexa]QCS53565.1 DUF4183 domain-containing protein [Priestia flexa]
MALQIMKILASATTVTTVNPVNTKLFYVTTAQTDGGGTLIIDAADFFLDDGSAATTLPALESNNSYYKVYINGLLQMEGLLTYTPGATGVGSVEVDVPIGESILTGTPVIVEVVNFTPASSTTVTT